MPRSTRRAYAPEFRRQMVDLVRAGRSAEELAKEFEPTAKSIRDWVAQADRDGGRRADGLTSAEREELVRLRREVKQLKLERESFPRRRPGSLGRRTRSRPRVQVREREPGLSVPRCAACWASPPAGIMRGRSGRCRVAPGTTQC